VSASSSTSVQLGGGQGDPQPERPLNRTENITPPIVRNESMVAGVEHAGDVSSF